MLRALLLTVALLAAALPLASCSGDDTPAARDSGTGARDTGPAPSEGGPPPTDAPIASDGPGIDTGTPPPTDGATTAMVTLDEFTAYANCMPVIGGGENVIVLWIANVSGATGTTATLQTATLTITGPATITQMIMVDNPVITLTGGSGSAMQRKTSGTPAIESACGELCGGATARIDVTFSIDGATVTASATSDFSCVF